MSSLSSRVESVRQAVLASEDATQEDISLVYALRYHAHYATIIDCSFYRQLLQLECEYM